MPAPSQPDSPGRAGSLDSPDSPDSPDWAGELAGATGEPGDRLTVAREWEGFPGTAFGGFVAGAVLVAAARRAGQPRPLSFFSRFHRPVPVGRAVGLALEAERLGRGVETWVARVSDDAGRLLASFSASFGRDGSSPIGARRGQPPAALHRPRPVWEHLVAIGVEPSPVMRRVGYRGETAGPDEAPADPADEWHLRSDWPACGSADRAVQAAVALMAIDVFVGPATMRACELDLDQPWPVAMPSLDLAAWFHAPPAPADATGARSRDGWLRVGTSVPVSGDGYAVGRTQVWDGGTLVAEGLSQVALVPAPAG